MASPPNNVQPTYQRPAPPKLKDVLNAHTLELSKSLNSMRIGVIQSFDPDTMTVSVQIVDLDVTSQQPNNTQTLAQYAPLQNVPVVYPQGGNFILTFPIAPGDECLVLFNDRQIDQWMQAGAGQPPALPRFHDYADAIALVGVRSQPRVLSDVSPSDVELRSVDGNNKVAISGTGNIYIECTENLDVNATSAVFINTPGDVVISAANVTINANLVVNGDVTSSGVGSLNTHVHSGVQPGSGDSGPPTG